jgi:zinc and cadmium transporter
MKNMVWLYSLLSVFIVSLISLIGVFSLSIKKERLEHILLYLVSFSVGALFGEVFLHILPEIGEQATYSARFGFYFLIGIILFFIIEKIVHWRHCHRAEHCDVHEIKVVGYTSLVGDSFHNFLDGMIIASSFMVSTPLGIATTLAVIIHEIPQEIGDFGVLMYSGFTRAKALLFNLASALFAVLGAILALFLAGNIEGLSLVILAVAGGGFIYIAGSDLIPELHKDHCSGCRPFLQLLFIICGIGVMSLLLLLE